MTPKEREDFELSIYREITKTKNHGSMASAADYLRYKHKDKVSRQVSPNNTHTNNIFGEVSDLLEGFNYRYPELEEFIWEKLCLRRNVYKKIKTVEQIRLADIAHEAAQEQLEVNYAISRGASDADIEREAFQAMEKSKKQYQRIVEMRHGDQSKEEIQAGYFEN